MEQCDQTYPLRERTVNSVGCEAVDLMTIQDCQAGTRRHLLDKYFRLP